MTRLSAGDLGHRIPVGGEDELGRLANSFNQMSSELALTCDGLRREQDKLTTIIYCADEGIIDDATTCSRISNDAQLLRIIF